jgi:hypothetical protein
MIANGRGPECASCLSFVAQRPPLKSETAA